MSMEKAPHEPPSSWWAVPMTTCLEADLATAGVSVGLLQTPEWEPVAGISTGAQESLADRHGPPPGVGRGVRTGSRAGCPWVSACGAWGSAEGPSDLGSGG